MIVDRSAEHFIALFRSLCRSSAETEWVEFKRDNDNPDQIGEYLSALANSAALLGRDHAYMLWGVDDKTQAIIGTTFSPSKARIGAEGLENWLLRLLKPSVNFRFRELMVDDLPVVLLEIGAALGQPVQFKNQEFIRVGSYKKKLKDHPEKERELWRMFDQAAFEKQLAAEDVPADDVLRLLDYPAYFYLLNKPLPETRKGIFATLENDEMIVRNQVDTWDVTNLGAILFAKNLRKFPGLRRKAVRVVIYRGDGRVETVHEQEGVKGYACGFQGLIVFVMNRIPAKEVIEQALRKSIPMFPELAIRELTANALIHQDFLQTGTGPMIEIFDSRIEITNRGVPLVKTERFLGSPPKSRNEILASFMRRVGICEERGTGVEKVVSQTEIHQLPAPVFETFDDHTRCVLFARRDLKDMGRQDRIHATYLHACLRYVRRNPMTDSSLRTRFSIDEQNSAAASRIIEEALEAGKIRQLDEGASRKFMKYVPWWA